MFQPISELCLLYKMYKPLCIIFVYYYMFQTVYQFHAIQLPEAPYPNVSHKCREYTGMKLIGHYTWIPMHYLQINRHVCKDECIMISYEVRISNNDGGKLRRQLRIHKTNMTTFQLISGNVVTMIIRKRLLYTSTFGNSEGYIRNIFAPFKNYFATYSSFKLDLTC